MDFTTQEYALNGEAVALSTLLDRTDMTINGNGALFDWNTDDIPANLTSTALDAIPATGFSAIVEWIENSTYSQMVPFSMVVSGLSSGSLWIESYNNNTIAIFDQDNAGLDRALVVPAPAMFTSGVPRRTAFTRTTSGLSVCVNGGTVYTDLEDSAYMPDWVYVSLGGFQGRSYLDTDCFVKRVAFYEPVSDGELQLLAAL
jgi:hypothetical protein